MDTTRATVSMHDITRKMDDVLKQLASVEQIAVDPAAVQRTVEQVQAVKNAVGTICCNDDQGCAFEVVNKAKYPVAV